MRLFRHPGFASGGFTAFGVITLYEIVRDTVVEREAKKRAIREEFEKSHGLRRMKSKPPSDTVTPAYETCIELKLSPQESEFLFGKHFVPGYKTNFAAGFVCATLIDVTVQEVCSRCERMLDLERYREKLAEEYMIKQRDMVDEKK